MSRIWESEFVLSHKLTIPEGELSLVCCPSPEAWRTYCEAQNLDPTEFLTFHNGDGKVYELKPVMEDHLGGTPKQRRNR